MKYEYEMNGGKINIGKQLKKTTKKIKKGFNDNIDESLDKTFSKKNMGKVGKFMEKQVLPGAVSVGIPLVGTAMGTLGAMYGIPPELTAPLTENLMQEYIPKKYQSKNKYVGLLSNAINMGVSGDIDPESLLGFQNELTDTVYGDLERLSRPKKNKQNSRYNEEELLNLLGPNKIKQSIPTSQYYTPDNPYNDLIMQIISGHMPIKTQLSQPIEEQTQPIYEPSQSIDEMQNKSIELNSANDALYSNAELGEGADSLMIKSPPYQQREGSTSGLLGGKIKKRRGRPRKIIIEEEEIYIKKKPSYKKFSHAKNSSLEQLLEAQSDREERESKKAMRNMVDKQTKSLTAMGYGIKPVKGSPEMKEKMRRLREMRRK